MIGFSKTLFGTALLSCGFCWSPVQATTLYATGGGSSLYTINSTTGAGTLVGNFGYSATYGLAFSPNNTLYAIVDDYSTSTLATVNTTTGAATPVGSGTNIYALMALVFSPGGTAYAASWGTNSLYTIDVQTGAATLVGALGFSNIMDLAFDGDGTLYGLSNGLYTINTTTGQGTQVVGTAGDGCLMGMTIQSSSFYATDYCSESTPLYQLNPSTGGVTAIGSGTGISGSMALTYIGVAGGAVPEPATWAMMLMGFGGIGVAMRRSRRRNGADAGRLTKGVTLKLGPRWRAGPLFIAARAAPCCSNGTGS